MPRRAPKPLPDPFVLYQRAVQEPDAEVDFIDAEFRRLRRRTPTRLREDFCGTGQVCCAWALRRRANEAVGLDLDRVTLDWGLARNVAKLRPATRERVSLLRRDVLRPWKVLAGERVGPRGAGAWGRMDVVYAGNFSWWVFHTRRDLLAYFRGVRRSLVRDGLFVLDIMGGWEVTREQRERWAIGGTKRGFTYQWHQEKFDPVTARATCHIGFKLRDGRRMPRAFTYDWRVWTVPETRDALADAGFTRTTVYWEGDDRKGGGNGVFRPTERGEACASFIAYIVAER